MYQKIICQITDVQVTFSIQESGTMWKIWEWKLDSFVNFNKYVPNVCEIEINTEKNEKFVPDLKNCLLLTDIPVDFFRRQVHQIINGDTIWSYIRSKNDEIYLQFYVSKNWSHIILLQDGTNTAGSVAYEYLNFIMPGVFLKNGTMIFHGVLMEHQNQGIIISAPSGTGKTTHARLWRDLKRALIINGDKSTCKKVDGVWTGYGLPWSGTSGEQINRNVPIKALVVLERGEYNEAQRIGGLEAFGAVLPHVQCPTWDKELADKAMELLDDFLNDIPIIRLRCRPDAESVEVLSKVLEEL